MNDTMTTEEFLKELEDEVTAAPFEHPIAKTEPVVEEETTPPAAPVKTPETPAFDVDVDLEAIAPEIKEEKSEDAPVEGVGIKAKLFKATAELLQEQFGISKEELDLDEIADEDWTSDIFQELVNELSSYAVQSKYDNYKSSNDEIKALLDIVEAGGKISQLDEYRDRRASIEAIDTSTVEGKIAKIRTYYKQVEKMGNEEIDDYIEFIQNKNTIDKTLRKVEEKYEESFSKERDSIVERQKQLNLKKQQHEEMIANSFSKILEEDKNFSKKEKTELNQFAFGKAYKLTTTGELITELDKALLDIKRKPEELFELSKFLKDREKYKQEIITQHSNKKTEDKFSKIFSGKVNKEVKETTNNNKERFKFFD